MNKLVGFLDERKRIIQRAKWLRPLLLVTDFILLIIGLVINPVLGLILGLVFILINEFFTPITVHQIFLKEIGGEIRPRGRLTKKAIRGSKSRNK